MATKFGDQLKAALASAGVTQSELARLLGFSPVYISDLANGRRLPPTSFAGDAADALLLAGSARAELIGAAILSRRTIELAIPPSAPPAVGRLAVKLAHINLAGLAEPDAERVTALLDQIAQGAF